MICIQFPNVTTKTIVKIYSSNRVNGGISYIVLGDGFSRWSGVKTVPGCGFTGTRSSLLIVVSL